MKHTLSVLFFLISLTANSACAKMDTNSDLTPPVIDRSTYQEIRGGLANSYQQFTKNKVGRVAFMGGSITEMTGWKEKVRDYLVSRFPDTKFEFIYAGIPSTGSIPGAFRLENNVLSKGEIDLLFEEAAVNDIGQDKTTTIRGMEGIVRHAQTANPYMDIFLMYFVDPPKIDDYNKGKTPLIIEYHNQVAEQYNLPSLNLAKEVTDRINAGEFTWEKDFISLHPSPFGHELYYQSIKSLLENCWGLAAVSEGRTAHHMPVQIDPFSLVRGDYADIHDAKITKGWAIDEKWRPTDGIATRKGFVDVPMLIATEPGAEATFSFEGTAIGICGVSGPDAGIIEYSVDDEAFQSKDLYTAWSNQLYLNQYLVFKDMLSDVRHELKIRILESKNEKSTGHACRIIQFLVNKPN